MKKSYDFSKGKRGAVFPSIGKTHVQMQLDNDVLETACVSSVSAELQQKFLADIPGKSVAFPGDCVAIERDLTSKIESSAINLENKLAILGTQMLILKWMTRASIGLSLISLVILLKLAAH